MQVKPLNPLQRRFLRLYLGRDERYMGHGTNCYKLVYGIESDRSAQSAASRLLAHPVISREVDKWHKAQSDATIADAGFVLEQSIRLYDRAMGDAPIEVDVIDEVDGVSTVRTVEKREYSPAIARQALELIGRHTSVQAFQDNVEHTHTHRLEQALANRTKQVERKAEQRQLPDIEGSSTVINDAPGVGVGVQDKETPYGGGQSDAGPAGQETKFSGAEATGK